MSSFIRVVPCKGICKLFSVIGCLAAAMPASAGNQVLSLEESEQIVLTQDPMLTGLRELAAAYDEQAVADAQLPDPKFKFGLMNFPTDTFRRDQEPMTQVQIGVQQMLPRGDSLEIKSRRTSLMAGKQYAREAERNQKITQSVRESWLELYYWNNAERIVNRNKKLFKQLVGVTEYQYGAGRRNQQDVIRAQLELDMLDDRITKIQTRQDMSRASLAKWVGSETASRPLAENLPVLPDVPGKDVLVKGLAKHPVIRAEQSSIDVSQQTVELAREAYKPSVMLDVSYGQREGRPDFVTGMVMVDIPLFKEKRQDRRLKASQHRLNAAKSRRDDRFIELRMKLDTAYSEWTRLGSRILLYEKTLLPRTRQNSEASLNAYQSDVSDFTSLMKAKITELETELKALRIRVDSAKAQSRLLYLAGDIK